MADYGTIERGIKKGIVFRFDTHNDGSFLSRRDGEPVIVLKELYETECDDHDFGVMFLVKFTIDGEETAAYMDELEVWRG